MTGMQFIEQEHVLKNMPQVYVVTNDVATALASQEKIERKGGIRLTNAMKESILNKVYDFKFKKSGEALDKLELRLSHKAMLALFGRANLDMLSKIGPPYAYHGHHDDGTRMTPEQLEKHKGVKVTFRVGSLGYQMALYVKDPLPVNTYHAGRFFIVKQGPLADEIVAWHAAVEEWKKEKYEMQLKVNAVLNSVTTFASLQKTWPGGERFYKHIPVDFPFRNQVPAVKVEELNAALGL